MPVPCLGIRFSNARQVLNTVLFDLRGTDFSALLSGFGARQGEGTKFDMDARLKGCPQSAFKSQVR
jgi:hypothetical protein